MTRAVIVAVAVAVCVAYLWGGARSVGVSERDRVFSPADAEGVQLRLPARDVPINSVPTLSSLAGRLSLAVALGRRSALRDLGAVATAFALVAFGAWLLAIGTPLVIIVLTLFCMAASPPFWGRGVAWTFDALSPALIGLALWLAAGRYRLAAVAVAAAALFDMQVWSDGSAGATAASLIDAFTPLGAFLSAIGLVTLLAHRPARLPVAAAALLLMAWQAAGPRSPFDQVAVPVAIAGWAAAAAGLTWLLRALPPRAGQALVTVIALVVIAEPALTRVRLWALGRDGASEARTRLAGSVRPADLPERAAVIADAHRADALLRLSSEMAGRDLRFVSQIPERVRAAADEGLSLFAFDGARGNLERFGFLFERETIGSAELNVVAGHAPCLDLQRGEWQDVSWVIGGGSFILHGSRPGVAPGGVVLRLNGGRLPRVTAIEPRSVPFEMQDSSLRVPATTRTEPVVVTLESGPPGVEATAEDGPPVRICPGMLRDPLTLGRAAHAAAAPRMNDDAPFAAGWHPIEADPDFFRWTAAPEALVRVAIAPPGPVRVTVTATPAARAPQKPQIGLIVNRCRLQAQPMQQGQGDYEWTADAACWRSGINHLWIAVTPLISPASLFATHDTRLLGARIGAIRLARLQNAK